MDIHHHTHFIGGEFNSNDWCEILIATDNYVYYFSEHMYGAAEMCISSKPKLKDAKKVINNKDPEETREFLQ